MPGETKSAIVPWHMWGETQNVELVSSGGLVHRTEKQIARVAYGRPDTWSFLFAAQIVDQSGQVTAGTTLTVDFDLTVGVGRSHITIPSFVTLLFDYNGVRPFTDLSGDGILIGWLLWTNTASNRVTGLGVAGPPESVTYTPTSNVATIVAQDIQVKARAALDSAGEPTRAVVAIHSYFAPLTHIRPEWMIHSFPGGEHKGT